MYIHSYLIFVTKKNKIKEERHKNRKKKEKKNICVKLNIKKKRREIERQNLLITFKNI